VTGYVPLNERPLGGHARLLSMTLADGPRDVLDVGCSSGYLATPLAEAGVRVSGIELDPGAAEVARGSCSGGVLVGDIESMELPFEPASFDAIVCGDLVEHLRDPGSALARLRPLLRPNGRLVLSTPNVANWAMRLSLLGGRWRYTDRGILDRTHAHLFTRKTLTETVEAAGYRVVELDHTAPVPVVGTPAVERAVHAVSRVRPSLFAYQFLLAATPR
jgi:2-polyprenyl-3-methyl-5-hydroxy-6-metoxy-1,4-benzoquinol methylase